MRPYEERGKLPNPVPRNPNWSEEKDRAFHDWLFAQFDRDRFHFYYTGYITIKRFGDLIAPYLQACSRILDAGCGCGEITCYLAQKFPDKTFLGIDHSLVGARKGEKNRERLGLRNVHFESRDFFKNPPAGPFDIVLFLDSFHHFNEPARVIEMVEALSDRVLMIEPHGDSQGNHVRYVDFDWINADLHKIRSLISHLLKDENPEQKIEVDDPAPEGHPASSDHEATEYRYPPEFYEGLLKRFDLEVRGTVSGLDRYGENVYEKTESNFLFNRLVTDILDSIDNRLMSTGHDIFAKHWIIYGEKKGKSKGRKFDGFSRYRTLDGTFGYAQATAEGSVARFYDIAYSDCQVPPVAKAGSDLWGWVHIINQGSGIWSSFHPKNPVNLSYHWLSPNREMVIFDGMRTTLGGKPVGPHECAYVQMRIVVPPNPGRYILQLDAVQERVTWFSQQGQPTLEREIAVEP